MDTYVYTGKSQATHRPREAQGKSVLTVCGKVLTAFASVQADYPTCRRCATKC